MHQVTPALQQTVERYPFREGEYRSNVSGNVHVLEGDISHHTHDLGQDLGGLHNFQIESLPRNTDLNLILQGVNCGSL